MQTYQRRRDALIARLRKIDGMRLVVPDGGYFFIANIKAFGVAAADFEGSGPEAPSAQVAQAASLALIETL